MSSWVLYVKKQYDKLVDRAMTIRTPIKREDIESIQEFARKEGLIDAVLDFQEHSAWDTSFKHDNRYVRIGGH